MFQYYCASFGRIGFHLCAQFEKAFEGCEEGKGKEEKKNRRENNRHKLSITICKIVLQPNAKTKTEKHRNTQQTTQTMQEGKSFDYPEFPIAMFTVATDGCSCLGRSEELAL